MTFVVWISFHLCCGESCEWTLHNACTVGFVPGSPWFNFSAALVQSQLVCLLPVGILNLLSLFQLLVSLGLKSPRGGGWSIKYVCMYISCSSVVWLLTRLLNLSTVSRAADVSMISLNNYWVKSWTIVHSSASMDMSASQLTVLRSSSLIKSDTSTNTTSLVTKKLRRAKFPLWRDNECELFWVLAPCFVIVNFSHLRPYWRSTTASLETNLSFIWNQLVVDLAGLWSWKDALSKYYLKNIIL